LLQAETLVDLFHGFIIILLHLGAGDMQINLGSAQAGMPEQSLDRGDGGTRFDQVAAEGVAELVAGQPQPSLVAVSGQAV